MTYVVPDQTGKRFVITGANSGTGKEATKRIAAAGGKVVMAVRTPSKGDAARDEILAEVPGADLEVRQVDLADLASVREFAKSLSGPVDVLVNNAGVMAPPKRFTTVDDFELQFGTNYLGPFALTNLLLPRILESSTPRVATMSSFVANFGRIGLNDLEWTTRRYVPFLAYGQSKLADMLLGERLATLSTERGWSLVSTIAHPGFTRTNLQTAGANLGRDKPREPDDRARPWSQEVEQGAEPLIFAAADPAAQQGAYYGPSRFLGLVGPTKRTAIPRSGRNPELAASLWSAAEKLTGTSLPG
ncbi:MAG: family NAD(P)-dependent oxidoreductase [Microbacteriaceae bacterium]|nr:family NAD(P)-dependent oxidoreductase [Microbacteriaceae bacterium]